MQRRSRRQSSQSVGKSKVSSRPLERTQYSREPRFVMSPVARRAFLDEGNLALRALLARDVGYQRARVAAERAVLRRGWARPTRASVVLPRTPAARVRSVFAFDLRSVPTLQKVRDAVICARRKVRRELVFASGNGGSRRNVAHRAPSSTVRC